MISFCISLPSLSLSFFLRFLPFPLSSCGVIKGVKVSVCPSWQLELSYPGQNSLSLLHSCYLNRATRSSGLSQFLQLSTENYFQNVIQLVCNKIFGREKRPTVQVMGWVSTILEIVRQWELGGESLFLNKENEMSYLLRFTDSMPNYSKNCIFVQ